MSTVFSLSSWLVLPFWLVMILAPQWRWTERVMRSPLVVAAPAVLYAALVLPAIATVFPLVVRPTLDGVAALLGSPEGATIAWVHFLAFDLFVGRWIYLDARERDLTWLLVAPILFLTLMLGPFGFLLYLVARAVAPHRGATAGGADGETRPPRSGARFLARFDGFLLVVAAIHAALFALFAAATLVDERTILGLDPWLKPAKFAASIAIYLATIAWLLPLLDLGRLARRLVSRSLGAVFALEMILIATQAGRGTTSHFNNATPVDGAVFGAMGAAILYATLVAAFPAYRFFVERPDVHPAVLWGIRAGLVVFLFAAAVGGAMVGANAHTIGAPDGGAGLPFVNWSTRAGELRIAHFLGMHALQLFPLAGYALSSPAMARLVARPLVLLGAIVALYSVFNLFVFAEALAGRPLVAL
jgi:hypothetical protein